jgi:hypothetical protein
MLKILSLSAFYDGSGKAHDPACRFVTLGGFAATDKAWSDLKAKWLDVLARHDAPRSALLKNPYFHSHEAMHHERGYGPPWDTKSVAALSNDLLDVVSSHGDSEVIAVSCSIKLDDYRRVKEASIPSLRRPERICLDGCFSAVLKHSARDSGIELCFDRKENFYPIVQEAWKHRRPRAIWWASNVTKLSEVDDMRDEPGIQIADLFAWLANRYHTNGKEDTWGPQIISAFLAGRHALVDQSALLDLYDPQGNLRPGVEVPFNLQL